MFQLKAWPHPLPQQRWQSTGLVVDRVQRAHRDSQYNGVHHHSLQDPQEMCRLNGQPNVDDLKVHTVIERWSLKEQSIDVQDNMQEKI